MRVSVLTVCCPLIANQRIACLAGEIVVQNVEQPMTENHGGNMVGRVGHDPPGWRKTKQQQIGFAST